MDTFPNSTNGFTPTSSPDLMDPVGPPSAPPEIPLLTAEQIQGFVADLFAAFAPPDREERVRAAVNHPVVGALLKAVGYEEALAYYAARVGAGTLTPLQSLLLGTGILVGSGVLGLSLARLGERREVEVESPGPVPVGEVPDA